MDRGLIQIIIYMDLSKIIIYLSESLFGGFSGGYDCRGFG